MSHRPTLRQFLVGLLALTLAGVAGGATVSFANHNFPDVGDGSFFGPAVNAGSDAGCYLGFPDGEFKGQRNPTRNQFAFWLHNCSPRIAQAEGADTTIDGSPDQVDLASVDITVGGSGTHLVKLTGQADIRVLNSADNLCSSLATCAVNLEVEEGATQVTPGRATYQIASEDSSVIGSQGQTIAFTAVTTAAAGDHTYTLYAEESSLNNAPSGFPVAVNNAKIEAETIPFGADGEGGALG